MLVNTDLSLTIFSFLGLRLGLNSGLRLGVGEADCHLVGFNIKAWGAVLGPLFSLVAPDPLLL